MKKRVLMALLALSLTSVTAQALTLDDARSQGRLGETLTGYVAPISKDKETLALVDRINKARAESYQQLADRNNIPVDDVAKMAGQKLVERAKPGEYVQGINGKWLKKTPAAN